MKKFWIWFSIIIAVVAFTFGTVLLNYTTMPAYVPVSAGAIGALLLWPVLRRCWMHLGLWAGLALHIALVGSLCFVSVSALNDFCASEAHSETGIVVGKYSKEHTRRGGRNMRRVIGKYKTYHVRVMMPDSTEVEYPVTVGRYTKIKKGARYSIGVKRGLFGYEVMDKSLTQR